MLTNCKNFLIITGNLLAIKECLQVAYLRFVVYMENLTALQTNRKDKVVSTYGYISIIQSLGSHISITSILYIRNISLIVDSITNFFFP